MHPPDGCTPILHAPPPRIEYIPSLEDKRSTGGAVRILLECILVLNVTVKYGGQACYPGDFCAHTMQCRGGMCVCAEQGMRMTDDKRFCLRPQERMLGQSCNHKTDSCFQSTGTTAYVLWGREAKAFCPNEIYASSFPTRWKATLFSLFLFGPGMGSWGKFLFSLSTKTYYTLTWSMQVTWMQRRKNKRTIYETSQFNLYWTIVTTNPKIKWIPAKCNIKRQTSKKEKIYSLRIRALWIHPDTNLYLFLSQWQNTPLRGSPAQMDSVNVHWVTNRLATVVENVSSVNFSRKSTKCRFPIVRQM